MYGATPMRPSMQRRTASFRYEQQRHLAMLAGSPKIPSLFSKSLRWCQSGSNTDDVHTSSGHGQSDTRSGRISTINHRVHSFGWLMVERTFLTNTPRGSSSTFTASCKFSKGHDITTTTQFSVDTYSTGAMGSSESQFLFAAVGLESWSNTTNDKGSQIRWDDGA
jgi:hypothetical protein